MRAILAALLMLATASMATAQPADSSLRAMSFNIRFDNPRDGEHAWPHRADRVASVIRFHAPDVVGLQEALRRQIDTLAAALPDYAWFGVGRDDGKDRGEFSPVFYRRDRLELLEEGTFWLSLTPEVPGSKGWDAAITRVATWACFRDRLTDQAFFFLNTHFDHVGQEARVESAALIRDRIEALADGLPVVVTGDFNVTPDNPAYTTMAGFLADARVVSETPPHGPEGTFFGFTVERDTPGRRIDFVFVSPGLRVLRAATLTDQWHGHYPSDHVPVLADVRLEDGE